MIKAIKAGDLRHFITIEQRAIGGQGTVGQPVYTWKPFAKTWAKVESLDGRKLELARQMVENASYLVTIRYIPNVSAQMRIVLEDGTILNIGYVQDQNNMHLQQQLTCSTQLGGV